MALPDLEGLFISDTYSGLLHTSNQTIGSSTFRPVYDGQGNVSKLELSNSAVKINDLKYPTVDGLDRQFLKTNGSGTLTFDSLDETDIPDLVPNPSGNYRDIDRVSVDSKGRVTAITTLIDDDDDEDGDVTYSGHIVITRTYFRNSKEYVGDANTNSPIDGIDSSTHITTDGWKFINIDEYVPSSAKTAIAYIETFTESSTRATVSVSRSNSGASDYPVLAISGESSGLNGGGSQFTTRLGSSSGNKGFWLKITDADGNIETDGLYVRIYLLGFQE